MQISLFKDEAEGTRTVSFWACVAITFGLAFVSLYGVWAEDGEAITFWIFVGKVFWSIAVVGAEFLAAMALQRALIAPTLPRKIGGVVVFLGLAWFCVHNVERGVHKMYPTIFGSDTQELRELAELAGTQATTIDAAAGTAIKSIPEQLDGKRTELAKMEAELKLISGDGTEASIRRSQQHLQGLGYYEGLIDGKWEELTVAAVLRRGNEIRPEMEIVRGVIRQLEAGTPVTTTATASEGQNKEKITQSANARRREEFGNQVTTGAWVLEGARSLGWIVYLSGLTVAATSLGRRRQEELDEEEHQNRLAAIRARRPSPLPEPVEAPPAPQPEPVAEPVVAVEPEPLVLDEPAPPPPEPELTDAQRRARAGGLAAQQARAADKAEKLIVVGDWEARDADLEAARMAAQ